MINTVLAIEKCRIKYGNEFPDKCKFDGQTGERMMSSKMFAKLYGCSVPRIMYIQNKGVTSLSGIQKVAEVFGLTSIQFLQLGEEL